MTTPTQSPTPEAVRAAHVLNKTYDIGNFSRFCDEPADFDAAAELDIARIIDQSTNLPALKKVVDAARGVLEVQTRYSTREATTEATQRQLKLLRAALDDLTPSA